MLSRERVVSALHFRRPDVIPVEYHPSPAGIWEHGAALRNLWERFPHDFGDCRDFPDRRPDPQWLDASGSYEEFRRDEWGVLWHQLIFGVHGHPLERPVDDWDNLDCFRPPRVPVTDAAEQAQAAAHIRQFYLKSGWISLFETMHAVRQFESVLMDLATDDPKLHVLADRITEYQLGVIRYLLARGVDAIQFGDDFGTSTGLMMSPAVWRRFFKPRYQRLISEIRAAGKAVFFHTCGKNNRILEDLAELGVDAIWPQLSGYEPGELSRFCRQHGIAIAIHPDRGELMTNGRPREIEAEVMRLADEFGIDDGGAWFYVEIDSGFPLENVTALIEAIGRLRGLA